MAGGVELGGGVRPRRRLGGHHHRAREIGADVLAGRPSLSTNRSVRELAKAAPAARGVKMGRKPKMTPHQIKDALHRRDAGKPMREIARSYNVSHNTISRLDPPLHNRQQVAHG